MSPITSASIDFDLLAGTGRVGLKLKGRPADSYPMAPKPPKPIARQAQTFERYRHRVTCDLVVEGACHGAIVTDLSASGLYVRTHHKFGPGKRIRLVLHEDDGELELDARIVREHSMTRNDATAIPNGLGVQITTAPEAYFHLLTRLMGQSANA